MMLCLHHDWTVLLVGKTSTGKTTLVRQLASLTNQTLIEFNLTPDTDSSELLGCFEQRDLRRYLDLVTIIGIVFFFFLGQREKVCF